MMRELEIATAPKRESRLWRQGTTTWDDLVAMVKSPSDKKECGNYVLGFIRESPDPKSEGRMTRRRNKGTVMRRGAITLDADHATADLPDKLEMLSPGAALIHTTFSSTPAEPRYRIIVPLDRDVLPDEYWEIAAVLMHRLGYDQFDPGSREAWRYMFRPGTPGDGYDYRVVDGEEANAEELLASFDEDLSTKPKPRPGRNKRDPFSEDLGWVGAFNRAYPLEEAIEAFELPYEAAGAGRWHYALARAQAGLNTVSEGLVFSHHVSDPANGKACSAFDLVRLHRFGELDEGKSDQTPVNRMPSHVAMIDLVLTDPRVKAEMVKFGHAPKDDFDEWAEELQEDPDDWRVMLDMDRSGNVRDNGANWTLIRTHDPVFRSLFYNAMTMSVETTGLPWRDIEEQGGATFTTADRAHLSLKIEEEHRFRPSDAYLDRQITKAAMSRWREPIREYLGGLEWDGKKRLERCLPGVKSTPYTRMVARKSFVAAVARMFSPGIKWDHTLILYGAEGLGKTYWASRMARGWVATLGKVGDKDTLLTLHRSWIMLADEGFSLKKADNDALKEFLTRTEDVFRAPYDRETVPHKRKCVIWGSTNDEVFLRRQEGNRRFLIVRCEAKVDFDSLTDEYVDQIWAEAVALYRNGEPLYLDDEQSARAATEREQFTEEDTLSGIVEQYLEKLVPDDWDERSVENRQNWFRGQADGFGVVGTEKVDRVCSAQLWCEALDRPWGEWRRADLLELSAVMKKMPGWRALPGKHRVPQYGPQTVFERAEEVSE